MKKTLITVGVVILCISAYLTMSVALTPTPGVTVDNFKRLYNGMPFKDAEALLGERPVTAGVSASGAIVIRLWGWHKEQLCIHLYEWNGKVSGGSCYPDGPGNAGLMLEDAPSIVETIRRCLGLNRS